jgi:hypothetical protein
MPHQPFESTPLHDVLNRALEPFQDEAQKKRIAWFFYRNTSADQKRILRWCHFMNGYVLKGQNFHQDMIEVIITHYHELPFMNKQTLLELGNSFFLLEQVFNARWFLRKQEEKFYKLLLNLALINGNYYWLRINPVFHWVRDQNNLGLESLYQLFDHLFVRFEPPVKLIRLLPDLSEDEIGLLMHILSGKNARSYPELPLPLSRKESARFVHLLQEPWLFNKPGLVDLLVQAKLGAIGTGNYEVNAVLENSNMWQYDKPSFLAHFEKWREFLTLITRDPNYEKERDEVELPVVVDFLDKRLTEDPDFSLRNRTFQSLVRAARDWHHNLIKDRELKLLDRDWTNGNESVIVVGHKHKTWFFEELTTGATLKQETEQMNHCVFSYVKNCVRYGDRIWSLYTLENGKKEKRLTIQVSHRELYQARGKNNRAPDRDEIIVIRKWAELMRYPVSRRIRVYDFQEVPEEEEEFDLDVPF